MTSDEVYVEIEVLKRHGLRLRRIAAEVECAVSTVRSHLAEPRLPRYERKARVAMHHQPGQEWSLEALARVSGRSRGVFVGDFRDSVGCTPGACLQA